MPTYLRPACIFATGLIVSCLGVSAAAVADASPLQQGQHNQPYALIFGTVWGPDNRPLYAVKIRIRRQGEKKARWELYSDHRGEFAQRVPAGKADYLIQADLKRYRSDDGKELRQAEEIKVHVENDERVDTSLHLTE